MTSNTDSATLLTDEQIAFFKDNGYLLLRGVLDPALCAQARDRLWDSLPADSDIRRDDPTTHVGPFSEHDTQIDAQHMRRDYRWQLRDIGTEPLILNLVYSETLTAMAEQLLGVGTLRRPIVGGVPMGSHGFAWPDGPVDPAHDVEGIRGIYCTLPYGDRPQEADWLHTDGHPFHLGLVGLINDVPPNGGGFKVWPKSHKRLYPTFWMQYDQARIPFYEHMPSYKGLLNPPEYHAEIERIQADTEPVDCWGSTGDVVLWHHRMAHMAGHNYSTVIRQAILGDFSKTDLDKTRLDPPQVDMWRDWSEDIKQSDGMYSDEFAREQRLGE
ncbi:MAG: phytanoyl-CoA dioxygenase family protein [Chloroflexota bacterium]